jgi:non-specific serine/threonine protein kinase
LIGRERELAVLAAMLVAAEIRLVTVTGPAGVGKTKLADAAADGAVDASRVLRVELASLDSPPLVADAIAAAAEVGHRSSAGSSLGAAARALGDERVLLVLDNFEHLAAAASDVAELLAACPGVTALVTSRHVLHVAGEHIFPLMPLAVPSAGEKDPARAARCAAVALFVARARARDPGFELSPDVTPAVGEICRRLDGLPLAIELAASRVTTLPPAAMIARWESAGGLDAQGARNLPPRQRTLRRAIDWSYDLLGRDERALLRRLAAFPGGFGIDAVDAVCRGDGGALARLHIAPIPALAALVDRSLIRLDPGAPASEPRYLQLRTVREYLRERLAREGEQDASDRLMAGCCVALAQDGGGFFAMGRSREQLDRLEQELSNLRAGLAVLVRVAPGEAVSLAADLTALWKTRRVREGREWVGRALVAAGDALPANQRARGLWTAALLANYQGDYAEGQRLAAASLAAAREADDPLILARALYAEAMAASMTEPVEPTRYREVLELCERLGDQGGIAAACNDLGELARETGALDEACPLYERALRIWRELGDASGEARAAHNLAQVMSVRGDSAHAAALLLEAFEASSGVGDRTMRALVLAALAGLAAARRPTVPAAMLLGAAEAELTAAEIMLEPLDEWSLRDADAALMAALGTERLAEARTRGRALGDEQQALLVARILQPAAAPASCALTPRELEVVRLVAAGLTNRQIAQRLVISDHTVHRHMSNILGKLNVRSRAAVASLVAQRGLL